jgi:hypothetical protein
MTGKRIRQQMQNQGQPLMRLAFEGFGVGLGQQKITHGRFLQAKKSPGERGNTGRESRGQ